MQVQDARTNVWTSQAQVGQPAPSLEGKLEQAAEGGTFGIAILIGIIAVVMLFVAIAVRRNSPKPR